MLFNSLDFAIFLPIVYVLYWFFSKKKLIVQNTLLLSSSYFFYACWDYRFLFLLLFSTFLDYFSGIKMYEAKTTVRKKIWLWLSISINLGFLGFFKYYNFFITSFTETIERFGFTINIDSLSIILPVGISFYTFHGLSYVIDVYYNRIKPVKNFIDYSVFVSFFPLLVAGPIERSTHLLPQIQQARVFNYGKAVDGLRQILWGLFKKVVIADNCAQFANQIFTNYFDYSGSTLMVGALFFSVQIYCDFSGYSDIAIGTAKLFGIDLLRNFAFPYFSRDIAEFWRRWHISLSSWFRDYLYIPLGGSKSGTLKKIRNTFLIFIVSGFWHGANWTFIAWGTLHAFYFLPLLLFNNNRRHITTVASGKQLPTIKDIFQIGMTFTLVTFAWVFFRAPSIHYAMNYMHIILSKSLLSRPSVFPGWIILLTCVFFIIEWMGREQQFAIAKIGLKWPRMLRWLFYYIVILFIFYIGGKGQQFIYFQF